MGVSFIIYRGFNGPGIHLISRSGESNKQRVIYFLIVVTLVPIPNGSELFITRAVDVVSCTETTRSSPIISFFSLITFILVPGVIPSAEPLSRYTMLY